MKRTKLRNAHASLAISDSESYQKSKFPLTRQRFTVSFFAKGARNSPNAKCPIKASLNHGRNRLAFSTGIECKPAFFDVKTATVKNNPNATQLLVQIKTKAEEFYSELKFTGRPIDLQVIKAYALDIPIGNTPNALEVLDIFLKEESEQRLQIGELQKSTFQKQKVWHRHLKEFTTNRYGSKALLQTLVPADATACVLWLKSQKEVSNDVSMKIVAHWKRVMNFALANHWIDRNPFALFRRKMENKRHEALTPKEVQAIKEAHFASEVLNQVRDIFLFGCLTGFAYKELQSLKPSEIKEEEGKKYIVKVRSKVKNTSNAPAIVPLGGEAIELLERYAKHPHCLKKGVCLPVQANQKINAYLKQIQHVAGIEKRLTTHVARRTAATILLNAGMPITSVSAMLGHADLKTTTRHYTRVNESTVIRDFQQVEESLKTKKNEGNGI